MPIESASYLQQASIFSDLSSLDTIRQQGLKDEKGAIAKAAQEFEAFFLKMMLKSMRQASEVIGENNLMSSQQEKMYTGMMDDQLAVDLSQNGTLGIAKLMMSQFENQWKRTEQNKQAGSLFQKVENSPKLDSVAEESIAQKQSLAIDKGEAESVSESSYSDMKAEENTLITNSKPNSALTGAKENIAENVLLTKQDNLIETQATTKENLVEPEKKPLFETAKEFVDTLYPIAKSVAKKLSVDPKVMLAQAALETGWGKYIMHDEQGKPGFNLFGIKANNQWQGDSIKIGTLEVEKQVVKKVKASFRKYQSFVESFEDYARFLTGNSRYQEAVNATNNPEQFVKALQSAGYATDPQYANKIMRIFSDDVLQKVDSDN